MLIVPVVEGLDWRRPPPVTVALILLNCLVFFFYQTGDAARERKALEAYSSSSLPALELPAYAARLRESHPKLAAEIDRAEPQVLVGRMASDEAFMRDLKAGRVVSPQHPRYAQWKADRARYEALENDLSYRRFGFIPAEPRPVTWLTSMFLHGDVMHLVGNMVFLFIVGVAVESALGGFWYLLLYLAGGLAGDALHFIVHPGSMLPSVGASGAISGLMGLFTVVFGLRQVNFFYWLLFVFGFRRMRGIVVLPIWIGWEILQYATDKDGTVGYMAHAGGLIGGALLGLLVVKRFSAARVEEFHGQREQEAFDKAEYERARALVAKLDFKAASTVFARLAERFPSETELLKQWHAIAKADAASEAYHRVVGKILALGKVDAAQRNFQRQVFNEYFDKARPQPRLDAKVLGGIGIAFARAGQLPEAERAAEALFKQAPAEPRLAALWDALAQQLAQAAGDEASLKKAKRYRALMSAQAKAKAGGPA
ncbi:MAG: rhomboid family intramembrane serine protease [Usitatibacter sp.]